MLNLMATHTKVSAFFAPKESFSSSEFVQGDVVLTKFIPTECASAIPAL